MEHFDRYKLAYLTIISGFITIVLFIVYSFFYPQVLEAKEVLHAILPMIATWVGAIIAFYFGRENFEAAQQQIKKMLDPNALDDIPVKNIMIHTSTMVLQKYDLNKKLEEYVKFLVEVNKSRLPIIDENNRIKFIIHKSEMDHALNTVNTESNSSNYFTIEEFLRNDDRSGKFGFNQPKGFVTVLPETSLESAIKTMAKLEGCKDIFITSTGNDKGTLLGWITDTLSYQFLNVRN